MMAERKRRRRRRRIRCSLRPFPSLSCPRDEVGWNEKERIK